MKNKLIIPVAVLLLLISGVFAPQASYGQHNEYVPVIAPYQPTISDAFKINFNPVATDTVFTPPTLRYETLNRRFETRFTAEPIKAARVGKPNLTKLYKFLVKAGFGNYTTPYGEFFVNNTYSRSYSVGGHLKHLSSSGKIKGYSYPGNSENVADFYGKKFFKNHVLGGDLGYRRDVIHYYGFKPDEYPIQPLDKNMFKQRFNLIRANFYLNSLYHPDSLRYNHSVALSYYYLNDYYKTAENSITVNANVNKDMHLFKITSSQVLGLDASFSYVFDQDSLTSYNAGLLSLRPYLHTTFRGFMFRIGVDITVEADSSSAFHFYPLADVQFNIVKNILIVYAGIRGNLVQNTFKSFTLDNPYINSGIPLSYTNNKFDIYGGIKSNVSKSINFTASASYSRIKNLPLYVNDTNLIYRNKFVIIYDDANLLNIRGEFAYQKDDKFKFLLGGNFYNYKMDNESKAWQKPVFDAYIDFIYNIQDKFIISAGITGRSTMFAKTFEGTTVVPRSVPGYADLNLGFEYRYSKILSAFLKINNVTTLRQYRYYNYPNYGLNMLAGVTYSF